MLRHKAILRQNLVVLYFFVLKMNNQCGFIKSEHLIPIYLFSHSVWNLSTCILMKDTSNEVFYSLNRGGGCVVTCLWCHNSVTNVTSRRTFRPRSSCLHQAFYRGCPTVVSIMSYLTCWINRSYKLKSQETTRTLIRTKNTLLITLGYSCLLECSMNYLWLLTNNYCF